VIKILIVDDHPLFRRGICAYVDLLDNYTITAEVSNGEEALKFMHSIDIDIVLLDIDIPKIDGFELLSIIRHQHIDAKVVMLTMHDEAAYANKAFALGADAYLCKDDAEDLLAECLTTVSSGKRFDSLSQSHQPDDVFEKLSESERHIFSLVSSGKSSHEIAELLSLSVRTVDNHRASISKKLSLRGPNALLKYAISQNIL